MQQLFIQNVPPRYFFCHHSLKKESQLQSINAAIQGTLIRQPEAALLQSLVPQGESVAVPVEALEEVAAAVEEDEEGPGEGINVQSGAHQPAEPIERLSHVAGVAVEIDTGGGGQGQQGDLPPAGKSIDGFPEGLGIEAFVHLDRDPMIQEDPDALRPVSEVGTTRMNPVPCES